MNHRCIILICSAALLFNVFSAPQDTFKIGGGAKFSVVNIRTNETRIVAAVRETNGQYYFPSMSRNPEFYNKLVTGYFSYDSLYTGKWDSVFITLTIAGNITAVDRGGVGLKSTSGTSRPFIGRASLYNLRGCSIARPAGVAVRKDLTSAKLWLNINHSNPVPGR